MKYQIIEKLYHILLRRRHEPYGEPNCASNIVFVLAQCRVNRAPCLLTQKPCTMYIHMLAQGCKGQLINYLVIDLILRFPKKGSLPYPSYLNQKSSVKLVTRRSQKQEKYISPLTNQLKNNGEKRGFQSSKAKINESLFKVTLISV